MKTRYLINKKGVYYLTTGKLLEYNEADTKGEEEKIKGVKEVKETFDKIRNEPHTFYEAVEITNAEFAPMNTRQIN